MVDRIEELRKKALEIAGTKVKKPPKYSRSEDIERLVEELNVYQIELELQNKELIKIQDQLIEANAKFTNLFDHAPIGYAVISSSDKIIMMNNTLSEMTGVGVKSGEGLHMSQLIHPDSQDKLYLHLKKVHKEPQSEIVLRMINSEDKEIYAILKFGKMHQDEQEIRVSFSDISKQVLAEKKLKLSQEILAETESIGKIGGFLFTMKDKSFSWTKSFQEIHGIDKNLNPSLNAFLGLYEEPGKSELNRLLLNSIAKGVEFCQELPLQLKNGEKKWVNIVGIAITANKKTQEIRGIVQDITQTKNYQEELLLARKKAENSDRLKTAFLGNISHEIRTPMNGILGFSELLTEQDISIEEHNRYVSIIQSSGERMLSLINDLIDISKIESNQITLNYSEVNVPEILRSCINFFTQEADRKGLYLKINQLPDKHILVTDKKKLEQVLTNLIKNAVKFTFRGSIELGCQEKQGEYIFSIKDTGIGIDKNAIHKIFNRFDRGSFLDASEHEGAGLGLSISKGLVETMGGRIYVYSRKDKGSTFVFTIPQRALFVS